MRYRVLAAALAAGWLAVPTASAQAWRGAELSAEHQFTHALINVDRAFRRRQSAMDPSTGQRPLAPDSLDSLAAYGFVPSSLNFDISVTALDTARSQVCMALKVRSEVLWRAASRLFTMPGVSRADSQCNVLSPGPLAAQWPTTVYAVKLLDTQDVMTRTVLPASPIITGVDGNAVTMPAITLTAVPAQWSPAATFYVTNPAPPAIEGQPPAPALALTAISVRDGFRVDHNCFEIPAQQSCTVSVQYQGSADERFRVGSLRLDFSDGHFAIISLLGRRAAAQ
jgi:hypothetical protein